MIKRYPCCVSVWVFLSQFCMNYKGRADGFDCTARKIVFQIRDLGFDANTQPNPTLLAVLSPSSFAKSHGFVELLRFWDREKHIWVRLREYYNNNTGTGMDEKRRKSTRRQKICNLNLILHLDCRSYRCVKSLARNEISSKCRLFWHRDGVSRPFSIVEGQERQHFLYTQAKHTEIYWIS